MSSAPARALALMIACRRLPLPVSALLVTVNVAGTVRSSRHSRRSEVLRVRPVEAAQRRKRNLIGNPSVGKGQLGDWSLGVLKGYVGVPVNQITSFCNLN